MLFVRDTVSVWCEGSLVGCCICSVCMLIGVAICVDKGDVS